ncbi:hypothetical protein M0R45_009301 [Rubus argutus]|uniref:Uncharacterized protein n=1 Tax=Rubus argutus TaxID=59490 RepID=A0AAW1Y3R2_RUBAR
MESVAPHSSVQSSRAYLSNHSHGIKTPRSPRALSCSLPSPQNRSLIFTETTTVSFSIHHSHHCSFHLQSIIHHVYHHHNHSPPLKHKPVLFPAQPAPPLLLQPCHHDYLNFSPTALPRVFPNQRGLLYRRRLSIALYT